VDKSQPPRFLEARSRGLPVNQAVLDLTDEGMPLKQTAELEVPTRFSELVPPRSAILDGPSSGQDYRLTLGSNSGLDALQMDGAFDPPGSQGELRGPTSGPHAKLSLTLDVPVNSPNWGASLANRVAWLINNNSQSAEIRLDPPQLGPLDVQISIDGEAAQIKFTAESGVTREILDTELPRLRDLLGESGFSKVDVSVSDDRSARGELASEQGDAASAQDDSESQESEVPLVQTITTSGIDFFV
jgi:flagellar hook-length control protein FliK